MTFRPVPLGHLLAICLAAFVCTSRADVIYSYTGKPFDIFPNGPACPPTCNVTGSFDLAHALAADLPLTLITPLSFSITSGLTTLTNGESTDTMLNVGT